MRYTQSVSYGGYRIRVEADGKEKVAFHNDIRVAQKVGDMGLLLFEVEEHGQRALYDIAVVETGNGGYRTFIGRNGHLIFSDDPAFPINKTDPSLSR